MRLMSLNQFLPLAWTTGVCAIVAIGSLSSAALAESDDVPCDDNEAGDVWTATIPAGANVQVRVDTNDAANAFDPAMDVIPANGPPWVVRSSEYLGGGDDEFPCANPPANATACPLASGENGAWSGEVAFLVFNLGGCTGPTIGTYDVTLTVNASPAPLTLAADDETVEFVFDGDPPPPEPSPAPEGTPEPNPEPAPSPAAEPAAEPSPQPGASPEGEPAGQPENEPAAGEPEGEPGEAPTLSGCICVAAPLASGEMAFSFLALLGLGLCVRRRQSEVP